MAENKDLHYIPGEEPQVSKPLDRYLPPLREGVVSAWLDDNLIQGNLILDPFGTSPDLAIEAAKSGYRVIVTANNPINRFILEILCTPNSQSDFQSAIAMLSSSQVGDERLEPHIKSLYETYCQSCGTKIEAESFIWRRGEKSPFAKIYNCTSCDDSGEHPVGSADIEKVRRYSLRGPHHARALERVAPLHDPDRPHVEEALEVYLPRALYALVTIINRLNKIPVDDQNHKLLSALLLLAFDRANTLWLYPKERQRPKRLTIPPIYREHNIWLAVETAVDIWLGAGSNVNLSKWPDLPPNEGGICIYQGRVKELSSHFADINIDAIVTAFPRPNQAFWTLSALWAGWLWGPDALSHFKGVLRRRRYDWGWHTTAIQNALNNLFPELGEKIPFFGVINEVEPGFLSSVIIGCQYASLAKCTAAMRVEDKQALIQGQYNFQGLNSKVLNQKKDEAILQSIKSYLQEIRGEPSPYLYLHLAALTGLLEGCPVEINLSPSDCLTQIHDIFQETLSQQNGFFRFNGQEKQVETGTWWILDSKIKTIPLADRVEMEVVKILLKNPKITISEIDTLVCQSLPGITPPNLSIIQMCLLSYAQRDPIDNELWAINSGDHPEKRRRDIQELSQLLFKLGDNLGFHSEPKNNLHNVVFWRTDDNRAAYTFIISASAILGKYILDMPDLDGKSIIVIPGSRSNLVIHKLNLNQHFQKLIELNWQFIKYRHVRQLAENPNLTRNVINEQLLLDPLTYAKPQMRLL